MKLRFCTLFIAGLILAAAARGNDYSFKEDFRHAGAFKTSGTLQLENVNGEIVVRTWDKAEILIEGQKSAKTEEELKAIQLTMDVTEGKAVVKVRLPKRSRGWFSGGTIRASVRFTVTVPATVTLDKVATVNGGVTVEDLRGSVAIETVNGRIRAKGLGGDAKIETVNGGVKVDFTTVAAGQKLAFETVNGSVEVELPADAGIELSTSVVNGNIDCDFPLTLQNSSGKRKLAGKIGDGRASLQAETVNGSIKIRRR